MHGSPSWIWVTRRRVAEHRAQVGQDLVAAERRHVAIEESLERAVQEQESAYCRCSVSCTLHCSVPITCPVVESRRLSVSEPDALI